MRYRVKDYTIEGQMIILPYEITLEDLRLLINETQEVSLCSSMFKNKALIKKDGIWTEIPNAISISRNIITVALEACTLKSTDKLTIEIDKGDTLSSVENKMEEESITILNKIDNIKFPEIDTTELAKESTLQEESATIQSRIDNIDLTPIENKVDEGVSALSNKIDNIDLSAVENKVQEESAAIQNKLNNLNVEVDLTSVAKQGSNADATNSAILEGINAILDKFDGYYAVQLKDIIGE